MATLHKFKLLATQCAVAASPTHSPSASPVFHVRRRRKTLRMLLSRPADRHRIPNRDDSTDLEEVSRDKPEKRVRRKLKELFVSSPPLEDNASGSNRRDEREVLLPSASANSVGGSPATRRGASGSLRPVSATFRYRLLRRAWRPMLVTIPE
ncbi:hypothetical protein HS088_TW03G00496 [Tripterygium wilfordii]|uniref:Uncharacterized protein n=1 Tax=Tripterygium wilfordii TaxID=458696 RepID=A0A7J7DVH4_TRIWF|nr:hypothetical protein HS088_TW03G00496 [Tripterygium wilfordii]